MLYVIATPIGNMGDMTLRAIDTLKSVDLIAAEDTRRTALLLHRYGIPTRMVSFHEHSRQERTDYLVKLMLDGKKIGLVTDSGTPCVSDPGSRLIIASQTAGIKIIPVPGPSALTAAVSCTGVQPPFTFIGFLPKKDKQLRLSLKAPGTVIAYESPYRLVKTLAVLNELKPGCLVHVCRELTKIHEEIIKGAPSQVIERFNGRTVKGEIVLIIESAPVERNDKP
jgi:16S rRNA (cytidine1402-2'-O)-methyltransferase